jgi:hypothetical protein
MSALLKIRTVCEITSDYDEPGYLSRYSDELRDGSGSIARR